MQIITQTTQPKRSDMSLAVKDLTGGLLALGLEFIGCIRLGCCMKGAVVWGAWGRMAFILVCDLFFIGSKSSNADRSGFVWTAPFPGIIGEAGCAIAPHWLVLCDHDVAPTENVWLVFIWFKLALIREDVKSLAPPIGALGPVAAFDEAGINAACWLIRFWASESCKIFCFCSRVKGFLGTGVMLVIGAIDFFSESIKLVARAPVSLLVT